MVRFRRLFLHASWQRLVAIALVAALGSLTFLVHAQVGTADAATSELMPDAGQFASVPIYKVLDTRSGTGEPGGAAQIAAGATVTVTVTGVDGIPADATAVVVNINALNATAGGYLSAYNADATDPDSPSVGVRSGINTSQDDTVPASEDGTIDFTNHTADPLDLAVTVIGYFTSDAEPAPGDTYFSTSWDKIADTTTGTGASEEQVPSGGSITVQAGGQGGIASGADTAVVQLSAMNASATGWLSAYAAGATDPGLAQLTYYSGMTYASIAYVPLSASGQLTITNHGSGPVDIKVITRGYFMPPATTPAGGEYYPLAPQFVYGSAGDGISLAANSSVTIQVTGSGDVPGTSSVSEVAEDVVVSSPADSGTLDVYRSDGTDPSNSPTLSFLAGDTTDVGYQDAILSALSATGAETITNHSSGSVSLEVTVVGFFLSPSAPDAPASVSATSSAGSATVNWDPPDDDGGSPITGYTVTAVPDGTTITTGPTASQATFTGLTDATTDTFTVTASNGAGTGDGSSYAPPGVVSGQVIDSTGAPVAGDVVSLYGSDPPDSATSGWEPGLVGTATTDSNGYWTFTLPAYNALPADAQAEAAANNGYLNLDAIGMGTATADGTQYTESAESTMSAYIGGDGTPGTAPVPPSPTGAAMVMYPQSPDTSAADTDPNEDASWSAQNDGDSQSDATDAYIDPPTDAYGFQEVGGDGSYNPFIASDGTNLHGVPVSSTKPPCCGGKDGCSNDFDSVIWNRHAYTTVGEYNSNWNDTGSFSYTSGAATNIGAYIGSSGSSYSFQGYDTQSSGSSITQGAKDGPYDAHLIRISFKYRKTKWYLRNSDTGALCKTYYKIAPHGFYNPGDDWAEVVQGASIWSAKDGIDNYRSAHNQHPRYFNKYGNGGLFACVNRNKGITYGGAASIGGVGIKAETNHSDASQQCIYFGNDKRSDLVTHASDYWHYVWGTDKKITDYPTSFYNY
jgi:hypothetical protein